MDEDSTDDFSGDYNDLINRPKQISDLELVADGKAIRNVGKPGDPDDAATKGYVDTTISSSIWRLSGNSGIDPSNQFFRNHR
jgi:hypothetical protein